MSQTFTSNDLVRFIYKETTVKETLAIQNALAVDSSLFDNYVSLMDAYMELPKVTFAPTSNALENILKYSSNTLIEA